MPLPNPRRTKIVATVGPASDTPDAIEALLRAGVDGFRLGLAHDSVERVLERLELIRKVCDYTGIDAAVLADLPGPKVRAGSFGDGVELAVGAAVRLQRCTIRQITRLSQPRPRPASRRAAPGHRTRPVQTR